MSEPRKIAYMIVSGSYSDYRVHCIVEEKQEAEKLLAKMNVVGRNTYYESYDIEEIDVVDSTLERASMLYLREEILDNGSTENRGEVIRAEWPWESEGYQRPMRWRWVRAPYIEDRGGRLEVSGTDHDLVRKTFEEKRAALITDDAFRARREVEGQSR